jgi:nucleoside-diphosphate-sugar epimerase
MRFLVFGSTGMLGSAFCRTASKERHRIFAVDQPPFAKFERIKDYKGVDVLTYPDLEKRAVEANVALDFSWIGTDGERRLNAEIQLKNSNLFINNMKFALSSHAKRYIAVGSAYEVTEQTAYSITKLYLHTMGKLFASQNNLEFIWGRIYSIYGPFAFKGSLLDSILSGKIKTITNGAQAWNWLYTLDAAQAFLCLSLAQRVDDEYWIAEPETKSLGYYANILNQTFLSDRKIQIENNLGNSKMPEPDILPLLKLGWKPTHSFEAGVLETIKFNRQ